MNRGRVVNALALIVLIAVVVPFVVYAVPETIGADHSFVVLSGSMEPTMSPGDVVVVGDGSSPGLVGALASAGLVDGPGAGVERGDVVTFTTSGDKPPTTHRIVEVVDAENGEAYRTKGDANEDPDPNLVRPQQVIGEVVLVIPYVGYVVQFADTTVGFAALVVLPLGLLVVSELYAFVSSSGGGGDGGNEGGGGDGRGDGDGRGGGTGGGDGGASAVPDPDGHPASSPTADSTDGEPPSPDDLVPSGSDSPVADPTATADSVDATVDSVDATADSADETAGSADATTDDDALSFSRGELRLALVLFAAVVPYAAFVAFETREAWSIAAAVGATLTLAFVATAYLQTEPTATAPSTGGGAHGAHGATPVAPGPRPDDGRERVPVDSVASLVDLAADSGDWLFVDDDGYFLVRGHAVYVYDTDRADDPTASAPERAAGPADDEPAGDGGERR